MDEEDRIVQFIPVAWEPEPEVEVEVEVEPQAEVEPEPEPEPELKPRPRPKPVKGDAPAVYAGDELTCRKCGKVWKSRRDGIRPCPLCRTTEWWLEYDLAAVEAMDDRLSGEGGSALQLNPSSGKVHCRLVLEVYDPGTGNGGAGGEGAGVVGVYRKIGVGWPEGKGLGVVRFRVSEPVELVEIMNLVKGVVNESK